MALHTGQEELHPAVDSGTSSAFVPPAGFNFDDLLVGSASAQASVGYLSRGTAAAFSTLNQVIRSGGIVSSTLLIGDTRPPDAVAPRYDFVAGP